jgi:CheY-specific phosphatase CheX
MTMMTPSDRGWEETLRATSVGVLEDLCFVCPDPAPDPTPASASALTVEVAFEGPMAGKVSLRFLDLPREDIAAAMLGDVDGGLSEAETRDALGEVANVICGQLLPRIAGADAVFDLRPPFFREKEGLGRADAFVALAALGGRIEVALSLTTGAIAGAAS